MSTKLSKTTSIEVTSSLSEITLINADCLHSRAFSAGKRYDFVYADPPFFTNATWKAKSRIPGMADDNEFSDRFISEDSYSNWLTERVQAVSRSMASNGVFCLHLDHHGVSAGYHALRDVFGSGNYLGEIVWTYGLGGGKAGGNYSHKHDTILVWAKDIKRVEINSEVFEQFGTVWDIQSLNPMAIERVGYPTQKPLELLERLISIFPSARSLLDPFCGSDTTLVAGVRRQIPNITGFDISENAIKVSGFRLTQNQVIENSYDRRSSSTEVGQ